ncbi:hypothetical protein OsI_29861 [Oryza sativa Indica Group]|uniref:Uncharacterized protein n=2 Tax=Oryza sativa TaxID=4530 RepID=Q6Z8N2_ORYSJ|nr:hypothetical protein OsI_29861 [Oryza sativa Indica Group]BAD10069.1 hypothetical protein [Oryza sativa Japonica Group]
MAGAARIASIAGCEDGGALRRPRCQIRRLFALYSGDLHLQIRQDGGASSIERWVVGGWREEREPLYLAWEGLGLEDLQR